MIIISGNIHGYMHHTQHRSKKSMAILRVLIAEDNFDIAENIGDFIEMKGHQVDFAYDGKMAVELVQNQPFDVVIMDIMMPKLDGLQATQQIREGVHGDVPIIMLTAKDTLDEKLAGFESGADDYMLKPFAMPELYARMQAQARKSQKDYHFIQNKNGIVLDQKQQNAEINSEPLLLNPTTFKIMWLLTKQSPELVPKRELEFSLWGDLRPDKDILRSHIYNLRKSLEKCTSAVKVIAKHGQGYQLTVAEIIESENNVQQTP